MTHATKADDALLRCACAECKGELAYRDAVRMGRVPLRMGRMGPEYLTSEEWTEANAAGWEPCPVDEAVTHATGEPR